MLDELQSAIRDAAQLAFESVRKSHPTETFYYYCLVTTGDALRPGPSVSSKEALLRTVAHYKAIGQSCTLSDLRWAEADSPYSLMGDEHFAEVERLFLAAGEHRDLPESEYWQEIDRRYSAMVGALRDLDKSGFFGIGAERHDVVINVVAPGEQTEEEVIEQAADLNPPQSLVLLRRDLGSK